MLPDFLHIHANKTALPPFFYASTYHYLSRLRLCLSRSKEVTSQRRVPGVTLDPPVNPPGSWLPLIKLMVRGGDFYVALFCLQTKAGAHVCGGLIRVFAGETRWFPLMTRWERKQRGAWGRADSRMMQAQAGFQRHSGQKQRAQQWSQNQSACSCSCLPSPTCVWRALLQHCHDAPK